MRVDPLAAFALGLAVRALASVALLPDPIDGQRIARRPSVPVVGVRLAADVIEYGGVVGIADCGGERIPGVEPLEFGGPGRPHILPLPRAGPGNVRKSDCKLQHSGGPYGENIFWGSTGKAWNASDAVTLWTSEKQYYNHTTNTCSAPSGKSCGHYTQVVWRSSTAIGCARVDCDNAGGVFIICNYNPPGNYVGQSPY